MASRTLTSAPAILPLYARAAAPIIPGASLLPFVPGGGGEVPDLDLSLSGVRAKPAALAAYARVCGFALRDHLPHLSAGAGLPAADGRYGRRALSLRRGRPDPHRKSDRPAPPDRGGRGDPRSAGRPTKLMPISADKPSASKRSENRPPESVWEATSTMLHRGGEKAAGEAAGARGPLAAGSWSWRALPSGASALIWGAATGRSRVIGTRFTCIL